MLKLTVYMLACCIFIRGLRATEIVNHPITYLNFNEYKHIVLTPIHPSLVCLRDNHWLASVYHAFQTHFFVVNSTAPRFSIRIFHGVDEVDLLQRAPWLQHQTTTLPIISESALISSLIGGFSLPSNKLPYRELHENSRVHLSGLHLHCIALLPAHGHTSHSIFEVGFVASIDFLRIFRFLLGLCIYFLASLISENIAFYYISGVSMAVLGSFLILLILGLRMFPKRSRVILQSMAVFSGGALSLIFFCLDYLRVVLFNFVANNITLIISYVFIVAFFATSIFYWFSVPETLIDRFPRTQTILKLFLRLAGIFLIASAPQLPNNFQRLNQGLRMLNSWIDRQFGVKCDDYVLAFTPPCCVTTRIAFGLFSALLLHVILRVMWRSNVPKLQRPFQHRHQQNYQWPNQKQSHSYQATNVLPPVPCAASSPANASWRRSLAFQHDNHFVDGNKDECIYLSRDITRPWETSHLYSPAIDRQQYYPMSPISRGSYSLPIRPNVGFESTQNAETSFGSPYNSQHDELLTDDDDD